MGGFPLKAFDIFHSKLINFDELAWKAYDFQYERNPVFHEYVQRTRRAQEKSFSFLPIDFFKSKNVIIDGLVSQIEFTSSATTGDIPSRHLVADGTVYEKSFETAFSLFYGSPQTYCFLALLPSYLERKGSSLVFMAEKLIEQSGHSLSGFYLHDFEKLYDTLIRLKAMKQPVVLLGVTFALVDFAEQFGLDFPELIIMETGGMKGRREELTREEVHVRLKQSFNVPCIHSEYGMTELLSQAYSKGNGVFECPPWMRIIITDITDPFSVLPQGKVGMVNVIDLANINSCCFIQTSDLGRLLGNGKFEIIGRSDHAELRGCSLMYL